MDTTQSRLIIRRRPCHSLLHNGCRQCNVAACPRRHPLSALSLFTTSTLLRETSLSASASTPFPSPHVLYSELLRRRIVLIAEDYGTCPARDIAKSLVFEHLANTPMPLLPVGRHSILTYWIQADFFHPGLSSTVVVTKNAYRNVGAGLRCAP